MVQNSYRRHDIICPGVLGEGCGHVIKPDERSYAINFSHIMRHVCKDCKEKFQEFVKDPKNRIKATR